MSKSNKKQKYEDMVKKEFIDLTKQFNELMKNNKDYIVKIVDNDDENILDVFNGKKKIFTATYEILGVYNTECRLFTWSKNMPLIDKLLTKLSKKIKAMLPILKNIIINNEYSDVEYLERMMYYLSNGIFYIVPDNIPILLQFCTFVTRSHGIINDKLRDNSLFHVYYAITDIIGT